MMSSGSRMKLHSLAGIFFQNHTPARIHNAENAAHASGLRYARNQRFRRFIFGRGIKSIRSDNPSFILIDVYRYRFLFR